MNIDEFSRAIELVWRDVGRAIFNDTEASRATVESIQPLHRAMERLFPVGEYRRSSSNIGTLLNLAVSFLDDHEYYLNVGVWKGYSLFAGAISNPTRICVGVDPFDPDYLLKMKPQEDVHAVRTAFRNISLELNLENVELFDIGYEDFFSQRAESINKEIGCFFYDADHGTEATVQALNMSRATLSDNCVVMLDDYNDPSVSVAVETWLSVNPDFETMLELTTPGREHATWWNGLALLTRRPALY